MDRPLSRIVASIGVLLAGEVALRAGAAGGPIDADAVLRTHGFTVRDIARIAAGEVVARTLDAEADEVAIGTAVRIGVPASFYVDRFRAIESFKRDEAVLQVRRFSQSPSAADMDSLRLDAGVVDDLRDCRPGDCGVKLDGAGIAHISSLQSSAVVTDQQISDAYKAHLAGYAARYLDEGDPRLIEYRDHDRPRPLIDELKQILRGSPYLVSGLPSLAAAVGGFRGSLPVGVDGFLYWSHERVGPKPVFSITHSLITLPRNGMTAIASKQIYASHFFTGSLGVTLLIETPGAPDTLVLYLNRSRLDLFGGLFGGAKRTITRSRARSATARMMRDLKTRLEAER
jgi:hypothetical protein